MFKKYIIVLLHLIYIIPAVAQGIVSANINGKVIDMTTQEPIPNVAISIPALQKGAITDANGNYHINNLPNTSLLISFSYLGYKTYTTTLTIGNNTVLNIELWQSSIEADEIIVTGSPVWGLGSRNSMQVASIKAVEINQSGATNLIDALSNIPGVSQITTGNAVSKPVIRGLSGNRVATYDHDVKQYGQQWGEEHGIEIDQFTAGSVEILKGPASLFYGSDALGGVINLIPVSNAPEGQINGLFQQNYSTSDGLTASNFQLAGNQNDITYQLNGTYKNAQSYKTREGYVPNSAFNEGDFSANMGINKKWGFTNINYSLYDTRLGLTEDEGENEDEPITGEDENPHYEESTTRKLELPYQHVTHQKIAINSNIKAGSGFLKTTIGLQQNQRREYEDDMDDPDLYMQLRTLTFNSRYAFNTINGWSPVVGISAETQRNQNKAEEALIPEYNSVAGGIYGYVKKEWYKVSADAGIRYDMGRLNGLDDDDFEAFTNRYNSISASIGAAYEVTDDMILKGNFGRGFRTPSIAELSSNGVHSGAFRYELGNPNLNPETSLQFDVSLGWKQEYISIEIDGFCNLIDNYIYLQNTDNATVDVDGTIYDLYRYHQGNAILRGFEFMLDFHPIKRLHYSNSISYVKGTNRDTKDALPFIPQPKMINTLKYTLGDTKNKRLTNSYVSVSVINCFAINYVDPFETSSPAYTLLNASVGTDITNKHQKKVASVFVTGNNLTNTYYIDHLSRYKPLGYANMGTNVTFGVRVPMEIVNNK